MGLGHSLRFLFLFGVIAIQPSAFAEEDERMSADGMGLPFKFDVEVRVRKVKIKEDDTDLDKPVEKVDVLTAYGRMHFRAYRKAASGPTWVTPYVQYREKSSPEWLEFDLPARPIEEFLAFARRIRYGQATAGMVKIDEGTWAVGIVDNLVVDVTTRRGQITIPVRISTLEPGDRKGQGVANKTEIEIPLSDVFDRLSTVPKDFSQPGIGPDAKTYFLDPPGGAPVPVRLIGFEKVQFPTDRRIASRMAAETDGPFAALVILLRDAQNVNHGNVQIYKVPMGLLRVMEANVASDAQAAGLSRNAIEEAHWLANFRLEKVKLAEATAADEKRKAAELRESEIMEALQTRHLIVDSLMSEPIPCDEILRRHGDGTAS